MKSESDERRVSGLFIAVFLGAKTAFAETAGVTFAKATFAKATFAETALAETTLAETAFFVKFAFHVFEFFRVEFATAEAAFAETAFFSEFPFHVFELFEVKLPKAAELTFHVFEFFGVEFSAAEAAEATEIAFTPGFLDLVICRPWRGGFLGCIRGGRQSDATTQQEQTQNEQFPVHRYSPYPVEVTDIYINSKCWPRRLPAT